ncbi:MAG: DNA replication and repair protein RecF [Chthoniobacterales bacterium]
MLHDLQLRNFRCFASVAAEFDAGFNFIVGANGRGKTTLLEAACVLARLQSQRAATLGPVVRQGERSFVVSGHVDGHLLQFYYSTLRRKVAFDGVEQRGRSDYLRLLRVVSFANNDLDLIRGSGELRRRYLDFIGSQVTAGYRSVLRAYERALRARNALLKSPHPRPRELAAYTEQLVEAGVSLGKMRGALVRRLGPAAEAAHRSISDGEVLALSYVPGNEEDFAAQLEAVRAEDARLRLTTVGPQRDDLRLEVGGMSAAQFASEGQQRTAALALKLAQAKVFAGEAGAPPLLLIDDIFGELDSARRNALLAALPNDSQKLVTATSLDWRDRAWDGPILQVENL